MKKQLSYYVKKLEEAGIDTSVFNLEKNGVVLKVENLVDVNDVVGSYTVSTSSDDLKKYALLFLRMYDGKTMNHKKGIEETGFNAYVRNALSYDYQFSFIFEGFKLHDDEQKIFETLFTKEVLVSLLHSYTDKYIQQQKCPMPTMYQEIRDISKLDGREFVGAFKEFAKERTQLFFETPKASLWKDAYKGFMAACTYQYLKNKQILKSDITVEELCELYKLQPWKIFVELEKICENEDVDLKKIDLENI